MWNIDIRLYSVPLPLLNIKKFELQTIFSHLKKKINPFQWWEISTKYATNYQKQTIAQVMASTLIYINKFE